jgi:hypothetical protein
MNSFYKLAKRRFSSTMYHHGLTIDEVPRFNFFSFGMTVFETMRVTLYFFLAVKLVLRSPSYFTFNFLNFKKARNHPDYMICDEQTFQEINKNTSN